MSSRFADGFGRILGSIEEPPSWESLHDGKRLRPVRTGVGGGLKRAVLALFAVLVVGFGGLWLARGGPGDVASGDLNYVRLEWIQELDVACTGDVVDNGGFDSATVEMWGPTPEGLVRIDTTAPDGTVEREIVYQLDVLDFPIRSWSNLSPDVSVEDSSVFRVVLCSNAQFVSILSGSPIEINTYRHFLVDPGLVDGLGVDLAAAQLAARGAVASEVMLGGRLVTLLTTENSGSDEFGIFLRRSETWVDTDTRTFEKTTYTSETELLGYRLTTLTVVERASVDLGAVSFATDDLYLEFERDPSANQGDVIFENQGDAISETAAARTADPIEVALSIPSEDGDVTWNLVVYDSAAGRCVDLHIVGHEGEGSLGGCSPTSLLLPTSLIPGTGGLNLGADGFQYVAFGQAGEEIVAVRLTLHDGFVTSVPVENGMFGYSSASGSGEDFVYLFEGLDARGEVVASVDLRSPGEPIVEERDPLK